MKVLIILVVCVIVGNAAKQGRPPARRRGQLRGRSEGGWGNNSPFGDGGGFPFNGQNVDMPPYMTGHGEGNNQHGHFPFYPANQQPAQYNRPQPPQNFGQMPNFYQPQSMQAGSQIQLPGEWNPVDEGNNANGYSYFAAPSPPTHSHWPSQNAQNFQPPQGGGGQPPFSAPDAGRPPWMTSAPSYSPPQPPGWIPPQPQPPTNYNMNQQELDRVCYGYGPNKPAICNGWVPRAYGPTCERPPEGVIVHADETEKLAEQTDGTKTTYFIYAPEGQKVSIEVTSVDIMAAPTSPCTIGMNVNLDGNAGEDAATLICNAQAAQVSEGNRVALVSEYPFVVKVKAV